MIFYETAEALAAQVTEEHYAKGMIYPPFADIRKISAHIAASVAAKAYELGEFTSFPFLVSPFFSSCLTYTLNNLVICTSGVATRLPRPADLVKYAESCMYTPNYRSYR